MKTLETCSWIYWAKYHLGIPDKTNDGALRGTICHSVFELLLNKKHKKHYDDIMLNNSIKGSLAVNRLIKAFLDKHEIHNEENYELIDDMILVGLNCDFFGEGGRIYKPEQKFQIKNKDPEYSILGYMDKPIKYLKKKKVKIVDYKSSKKKFSGDDLGANIQGLMYSLAAKKLWPKYKPVIEFLFLRFGKKPSQILEFSDDEIAGFEHYLAHMNKIVNNFSEIDAQSNFAQDEVKNRWLCGMGKWVCPLRESFTYFVLLDKNKKIIKKALEEDDLCKIQKIDEKIETREYEGCPKMKSLSMKPKFKGDPFDFEKDNDPFEF